MALHGIDISNWQWRLDLSNIRFDFVIVKATEGIGFVDPYCNKFYQQAKSMGKLLGFYHFARPESNSAKAEAEFFYKHTSNYFKEAIPILDWESPNRHDVKWALEWLKEIERLSGVKPMIYMSESVVNYYDWTEVVNNGNHLWVAKYYDYASDKDYDMSHAGPVPQVRYWSKYWIWQWTSNGRLDGYDHNLDCDVFYGTEEDWKRLASGGVASKPEHVPIILKPADPKIVSEVLNNKYGIGIERVNKLKEAGYNPDSVQKKINELYAIAMSCKKYCEGNKNYLDSIAKLINVI